MNEVELLESLNPVPSERGNPGPPVVPRSTRPGRQVTAAALVASVVLVAGLVAAAILPRADDRSVELQVAQPAEQPSVQPAPVQPAPVQPAPAQQAEPTPTPPPTPVSNAAVRFQPDVHEGEAYGRLVIPAIDLDLIAVEGVGDEALRRGPGHHPSTPAPGRQGNAVFWGHRTTYGAPFSKIDELSVDDQISITTVSGIFEYRIVATDVVAADSVEHLQNFGDSRLTLVANHPEFSDRQRIVVTAVLVGDPLPDGSSSSSETPSLDAGSDGVLVPRQVVAIEDRYVGLAYDQADRRRVTVVASTSGETWQPVDGAPTIYANSASISQHDGEVHIVSLDTLVAASEQQAAQYQLFHYTSEDFEDWQQWSAPLPPPAIGRDQSAWIVATVSAEPGVLVQLVLQQDFASSRAAVLEAGYKTDDICSMTGTATEVEFRPCGTDETIELDIDGPQAEGPIASRLLIGATDNGTFAEVSLPQSDAGDLQRSFPTLYAANGGFGIAGHEALESADGVNWLPVETFGAARSLMAVRGSERVLRSRQPATFFGPGDSNSGMAFSPDGSAWEPVDLDDLFVDDPRPPLFYSALVSGPGGWALIAQRKAQVEDFDQLDRTRTAGASDFVLTNDGFALEGHTPFGPAVLRTNDGVIVREWEHLEVGNPEWSGLEIRPTGIAVPDESGEVVTSFDALVWATLFQPRETHAFDVLYSSDGTTWERHESAGLRPPIVVVGESELLIGQHPDWLAGQVSVEFTTVDLGP